MDYNFLANIEYCKQFVDYYAGLVFYSHIPPAVIALFVGLFIFFKSKSLLSKILLSITVCFAIWSALDLGIWMNYDHASFVMATWAPIEIFSTLIFVLCLYFIDVFTEKRDVPFRKKLFFGSIIAPLIIFAPTTFYLTGFNLQECTALETPYYLQYALYLKIILSLYIVGIIVFKYIKAEPGFKKQILLLGSGVTSFILFFFVAGRVSEYTLNYSYEIYGLFGMPLFIMSLAYLIVKFKVFQVKVLGAQALVLGLVATTASQVFITTNTIERSLSIASLVLVTIFGYQLVKSIKREIQAKEKVQSLVSDLQKVNTRLKEQDIQKTEFISFATHQLRSPITAIKGHTSLILEGDAGPISEPVREITKTIFTSIKTMANIVEDYLNMSRIELGTMKYNLVAIDFKDLLKDVVNEQKVNIEGKGLTYTVSYNDDETYPIKADPDKFKQVIMNIVDNSIKYTPHGSLALSLMKSPEKGTVTFKVSDTGVGIKSEVIPKLFKKFSRAPNASEANIHGTGLGLFIAKEIMIAHGGRIFAESEGEGKGSQFYVEVPIAR